MSFADHVKGVATWVGLPLVIGKTITHQEQQIKLLRRIDEKLSNPGRYYEPEDSRWVSFYHPSVVALRDLADSNMADRNIRSRAIDLRNRWESLYEISKTQGYVNCATHLPRNIAGDIIGPIKLVEIGLDSLENALSGSDEYQKIDHKDLIIDESDKYIAHHGEWQSGLDARTVLNLYRYGILSKTAELVRVEDVERIMKSVVSIYSALSLSYDEREARRSIDPLKEPL